MGEKQKTKINKYTKIVEYEDVIADNPFDSQTLYIQKRGGVDRWAYFSCPCGCGAELNICLQSSAIPYWDYEEHDDGTVSFSPSILHKVGCQSHFYIRHNIVEWC